MNKALSRKKEIEEHIAKIAKEEGLRKITHDNIEKLHDIPTHQISLSEELTYERNLNRSMMLLIEMDKNGQLVGLEKNLKWKIALTPQEKVLKQKIKEYRRTQGDPNKIRELDKRWRLKPQWLIAAGVGIARYYKNNNIEKTNSIQRHLKTNKDRRTFLRNQGDVYKVMQKMVFAINQNKKLNALYSKYGLDVNKKPNNKLFARIIESMIDSLKNNPSMIKEITKDIDNPRLRQAIVDNPRFLTNYMLDNRRKMNKLIHTHIRRNGYGYNYDDQTPKYNHQPKIGNQRLKFS